MNYKTYAEAKIANPDSEIVTTGKNWSCHYSDQRVGTFEKQGSHIIRDNAWIICNPADYCSSLKEFLDAGFKLTKGDFLINRFGNVGIADDNLPDKWDHKRYILSAASLNGGCKIPAKAEQWTVYNNTLPLCDLTDEQAAMLFNAWRKAGSIMCKHYTDEIFVDIKDAKWVDKFVYRIKPKSERELFIDKSKLIIGATTDDELVDAVIADLFDAGARYKDLTQYFGENI